MPIHQDNRRSSGLQHLRRGCTNGDCQQCTNGDCQQETKGAAAVIKRISNIENLKLWLPTAYFSVCLKTGTARYLDL